MKFIKLWPFWGRETKRKNDKYNFDRTNKLNIFIIDLYHRIQMNNKTINTVLTNDVLNKFKEAAMSFQFADYQQS
jgi:hypothetical protein